MESIFVQEDVLRELTVVNGQGLPVVVSHPPVMWRPVLDALINPTHFTELRITYWLKTGPKNHPLLRDYEVPGFSLVPRPSDRLISTTVIPTNIPIDETIINDPQNGYEFDALAIKLLINNNGRREEMTTCGRVRIYPHTGQMDFVTR